MSLAIGQQLHHSSIMLDVKNCSEDNLAFLVLISLRAEWVELKLLPSCSLNISKMELLGFVDSSTAATKSRTAEQQNSRMESDKSRLKLQKPLIAY